MQSTSQEGSHSSRTGVSSAFSRQAYLTGTIGKLHLFGDPVGFDLMEILRASRRLHDSVFYDAKEEKTYTGEIRNDAITTGPSRFS